MTHLESGAGGWSMLARKLAQRRRILARIGLFSLLEVLPGLLSGLLIATALDRGFLRHRPAEGFAWLALLAMAWVVKAAGTRMMFPALRDIVEPLRDDLIKSLVTQTLQRAVRSPRPPDSSSVAQLTSQVEMTRQLVSALIRTLRPLAFALVGAVIGMTALAPVIPMFVLPPLALALLLFAVSLRSMVRRRRAAVIASEGIANEVGSVLSGIRDVVALGAQGRAMADIGSAIDAQENATRAAAKAVSTRILVIALGYYVPLVALLASAPQLMSHDQLTTGGLIGAVTYLTITIQPALNSFMTAIGGWGLQLGTVLQRLHEACSPGPQLARDGVAVRPSYADLNVTDLTFAYAQGAEPVIRNLSVSVPEGDHLAILGPSGIGKSTLAALLVGLQTTHDGQISLGGTPVRHIGEAYLRQDLALIPQEAYIFHGTLRDNITYLYPEATEADVDRCCDAVGLRPLVNRLGGYDAVLQGDNVVLSDGERQLIALARVYLSPARVVILDEATSNLDPVAEARVEEAFATRDGTLIVIAHRISSARRADRILLLDGTDAYQGNHQQLLQECRPYADLVSH